MPLLDHFHPPLTARRQWQSFHSAWLTHMVARLNEAHLPPDWFAEPNVKFGVQAESDVAALRLLEREGFQTNGKALATVACAPPLVTAPVDFAHVDVFELQVINPEGGARVVAVVELVSPGNKDRPSRRQAFAVKCASYLQQGIAVIVVDLVTEFTTNLHKEIFDLLRLKHPGSTPLPSLYGSAYRVLAAEGRFNLEAWLEPLKLGESLPTLPLWIAEDYMVPLELEETYMETCKSLRIRPEDYLS